MSEETTKRPAEKTEPTLPMTFSIEYRFPCPQDNQQIELAAMCNMERRNLGAGFGFNSNRGARPPPGAAQDALVVGISAATIDFVNGSVPNGG